MGKLQRNKGHQFERDVRDAFAAAYNRPLHRNIGQARDGGNDLDVGPFCVEVKIRKTLGTVYAWLQQAIAALPEFRERNPDIDHAVPIVVARQDGDTSPLVILRLSDFLALTRDEVLATPEPEHAAEPPKPCPSVCNYVYTNHYSGETVEIRCQAGAAGHEGEHIGFTPDGCRLYWS